MAGTVGGLVFGPALRERVPQRRQLLEPHGLQIFLGHVAGPYTTVLHISFQPKKPLLWSFVTVLSLKLHPIHPTKSAQVELESGIV